MGEAQNAERRLASWARDFGDLNRPFADDVLTLLAEIVRLQARITALEEQLPFWSGP